MTTIAALEPARIPELDQVARTIGPAHLASPAQPRLRSLVDELAHTPLPQDPHDVARLRAVVQDALAQLPSDHPIAGSAIADAGAALLVRLLVRLADDLQT